MAEPRRVSRKKPPAHPHHGGAWKVAYADFVTAMMALFMVMWLLASTDQQSRQEISRYFRTGILPDGDMAMQRAAQKKPAIIEDSSVSTPKKGAPPGEDDAKELGKAIESLIKTDPELAKLAAQVSVSVTEQGVLIETVDRDGQSMLFDLASSELKPALVDFLAKLGPLLSQRKSQIRVMGHTDARPYISRTGRTNWDLSYERASNARRVLESNGLLRGQVDAVQAHGPSQLRNTADPYAAENRRLSVLVLNQPEAPAETKDPASPPAPESPAPEAVATPPSPAPAAVTPAVTPAPTPAAGEATPAPPVAAPGAGSPAPPAAH